MTFPLRRFTHRPTILKIPKNTLFNENLQERETGGGDHKKHKKDKKKHKERERSREKDAKTPSLKIKMAGGTPSMSPSKGEGDMLAPIPKITLKLGDTVTKVTGQQE